MPCSPHQVIYAPPEFSATFFILAFLSDAILVQNIQYVECMQYAEEEEVLSSSDQVLQMYSSYLRWENAGEVIECWDACCASGIEDVQT